MKPKERQAYILEKVREEKFISVEKLSIHFKITVQSIRKDLNILAQKGLIQRVYGGVKILQKNENISYSERKIINYDAKNLIAGLVAKKIKDNSSIFFSIGTTPEMISEKLLEHKNLKIITNNLNVALTCCKNESFEIILLGGKVRNKHLDILGTGIKKFFSAYKVDYGIFGVASIDKDGSLFDFSHEEIEAREAIRKNSKEIFLVADYSKFNRSAYIKGGDIKEIDSFFCDKKPPSNICKIFSDNKIKYFYAGE